MATFESYINQLSKSFLSETSLRSEDGRALEALFGVIALTFANRGFFSGTEVMLANDGEVNHQRDNEDAFLALTNSKTKFTVGSWRVYARNFGVQGNIANSESEYMNDRKLQVRVLESWVGDRNGEVHGKRAELRALLQTQRHMTETVKKSFMAIDRRDVAMRRINNLQRGLDHMPLDRISLQLEEVRGTNGVVRLITRETISTLSEVDVIRTLGGYDTVVVRNGVGSVIYDSPLSN